MKVRRILCPGAYTWRNKGDAALIQCMLSELRRHFHDSEFVVLSDSPNLDSSKFGVDVLPMPFDPRIDGPVAPGTARPTPLDAFIRFFGRRRSRFARALTRLARRCRALPRSPNARTVRFFAFIVRARLATALLGRGAYRWFSGPERTTVRAFCETDVAIFAPGGYLLAPKPEHVYWYRHLGSLLLAHWLGLPIILLACSIGPFHGRLNRWLARWVLNRADLIIAREEISVAILNETQVTRPRVHLTTDIAFLLKADPDALPDPVRALLTARSGTLKIGISIRSYDFPGHPTPQTQAEQYVTSMASLVRHVIEVHHATVFLVPQVTVPRGDDTEITQLVAKLSGVNGDDLALIDGDLSPSQLKGLYGAMDLFVGVRMHANIFALAAGVPTLAIAYEPKTRGIMRRLGLSDFVIGIRELDEGSLVERFDCLFQSRQDIRQRLAAVLPEVRREASRSADIAAEYLAGLKERDDSVAKATGASLA